MTTTDKPDPPKKKEYFDLDPKNVPLFKLRTVITQWILPLNSVLTLFGTLGLNAVLASGVDLLTPRLKLFPWLAAFALALTLACVVYQARLLKAWGAQEDPKNEKGLGKFLASQATGTFAAVLLIVSTSGAALAWNNPDPRGVLASSVPTLATLQQSLLGLRSDVAAVRTGVEAANVKLDRIDAVQAEAASRRAAAASRPESLGALSLSLLPRAAGPREPLHFHLAAFVTGAGASLDSMALDVGSRDDAASSLSVTDLTGKLAGGGDHQTMQFSVPASVRLLRLCLHPKAASAAPGPALQSDYRVVANGPDLVLQPVGAPRLVALASGACEP